MNNTGDDNNNNDDAINNINNTNDEEQRRRKGKGRKKISMEKIQNETNLQVTFSKRRAGVFKKASELSTLCGAECAVVVFSPGNKPHSFGHPSVETVANRFLINTSNSDVNPQENVSNHLMMAHNEATMYQRNHELVAIDVELEREKQRKKEVDEIANIVIPPLDQLTYEQLEQMKKSIESFKHAFEARLKSKTSETSWWANQDPSTQQHQGLGFPAPIVYGYGATNIVPTVPSSSSASFDNPFHNFGYNMQYPPMVPSGFNSNYGNTGVNPATVIPYDGIGRASGSGSGSRSWTGNRNAMGTDEDPNATPQGAPNHNTGFGGNYGNSF